MNKSTYLLSPLNLALDGSLDLFDELYKTTYNLYLNKLKEDPFLILDTKRLNTILIPEIIPSFELLAFRRLRIFTKKLKKIYLRERHFKRFSFIDEVEIQSIKRYIEFSLEREWTIKWGIVFDEKYRTSDFIQEQKKREEEEILRKSHDLLISFTQFLGEFQRVVTRAIQETIQQEERSYSIFDARRDVEDHISQRMMRKRNECIIPKTTNVPPTSEPLYVFDVLNNLSCKQNRHHIVIRKYYALHADGEHTVVLPVHYCEECNRYMIGRLSLDCFREFCGNFIVQTHTLCSDGKTEWEILRESKLHKLGYNVVEGKMSAIERQNLLVALLEAKYISFFEIVATIEQNIRMFKGHYKMQNAVQKWQYDLQCINEYVARKK